MPPSPVDPQKKAQKFHGKGGGLEQGMPPHSTAKGGGFGMESLRYAFGNDFGHPDVGADPEDDTEGVVEEFEDVRCARGIEQLRVSAASSGVLCRGWCRSSTHHTGDARR